MGTEIERKFLVRSNDWEQDSDGGTAFQQGYLSTDKERSVRVRRAGQRAFLTIKGASQGATRREYEYDLPLDDAEELLEHLCHRPVIDKVRHRVEHAGHIWEVDVFAGENAGLVLAEVELEHEDAHFDLPSWAGREVTEDSRFSNARLSEEPWRSWPANEQPSPERS